MLLMMGEETPENMLSHTYKRQVINLWNCCILLVNLFESYDDARTYERQIYSKHIACGPNAELNMAVRQQAIRQETVKDFEFL